MQLNQTWPSQSDDYLRKIEIETVNRKLEHLEACKRIDVLTAEIGVAVDALKAVYAITAHHHCECPKCVDAFGAVTQALEAVDGKLHSEVTLCRHRVASIRGEPRYVWVECDAGDRCVFKETRKVFREVEG